MDYNTVRTAYKKVTTPEEGQKAALLKWKFWSTCTMKHLQRYCISDHCGLCKIYFSNTSLACPLVRKKQCPLSRNCGCCVLYAKASRAEDAVLNHDKPISVFHAAARNLRDKIATF